MSDRHEMQAEGTHPAPCARHCESTAYEIEIRRLRSELAASRHELVGAKKSARAQARIIESLQQQRAHLHAQRDKWIEARNTLDSERAANATLTEELAASREHEARMQWQPIDTAPREGTWVLLGYFPSYMEGVQQGGMPEIAYWSSGAWANNCGKALATAGPFSPTHWMPLPAPPSAALAEGAQG